MDEPCSALDPTSTRRIESTIEELRDEVTIVIVTHNMQQAHRVSDYTAFFLAEQGTPGLHHRARADRGHVRLTPGPEDHGLCPRSVRLSTLVFMAKDSERLAAGAFTRASVEAYLQAAAEQRARIELAIAEAERRRERAVEALARLEAMAPAAGRDPTAARAPVNGSDPDAAR